MENFTREDLKYLMRDHPSMCLSMYMPTHPRDANHQQDRIRLKNLLRQAQQSFEEQANEDAGLKTNLENARELIIDDDFWSRIGEGLAFGDRRFADG